MKVKKEKKDVKLENAGNALFAHASMHISTVFSTQLHTLPYIFIWTVKIEPNVKFYTPAFGFEIKCFI